jgi:hypothetical protein
LAEASVLFFQGCVLLFWFYFAEADRGRSAAGEPPAFQLFLGHARLSWKEILEKFKAYAATNENADWLALYNESRNFDEKAIHPLRTDFAINGLLVQKIERGKGGSAVMEMLSCGKKEADNAKYFKALEKITGISKSDFSSSVVRLIKEN